jgi:hypothetical protein
MGLRPLRERMDAAVIFGRFTGDKIAVRRCGDKAKTGVGPGVGERGRDGRIGEEDAEISIKRMTGRRSLTIVFATRMVDRVVSDT